MCVLCWQAVNSLKDIFPELVDASKRVMDVLQDEEMTFNRTLDKGLKEFNKIAGGLGEVKCVVMELCSYKNMKAPLADSLNLAAYTGTFTAMKTEKAEWANKITTELSKVENVAHVARGNPFLAL